MYLATLSSLHSQVLNARQVEVLMQFRFYLQVLSVSAKQPDIQQQVGWEGVEAVGVRKLVAWFCDVLLAT